MNIFYNQYGILRIKRLRVNARLRTVNNTVKDAESIRDAVSGNVVRLLREAGEVTPETRQTIKKLAAAEYLIAAEKIDIPLHSVPSQNYAARLTALEAVILRAGLYPKYYDFLYSLGIYVG